MSRQWSASFLAVALAGLCLGGGALAQDASVAWRTVGPGVEHAHFTRATAGAGGSTGPWPINLLRIDPAVARLDVVRAMDETVGLETVSSLAARHGAIAAVNGGYFQGTGTFRGDPSSLLQIDGTMLSEPDRAHASVGIIRTPAGSRLIIGTVAVEATVTVGGRRRALSGLNRHRGENEIVAFTPEFHRTTLTPPDGVEVIVRSGRIEAVRDGAGSTPIPADGLVLSARGAGRRWLLDLAAPGVPVTTSLVLRPVETRTEAQWREAEDIVAAGPIIVRGGKVDVNLADEQMRPEFAERRSPRSAIGALADGRILLATIDGRRPPFSVGMSLDELAQLMIEFGAVEAMNLDGGGSSTMVVEGKVVNAPSDAAGERPVSDAIIVRAKR